MISKVQLRQEITIILLNKGVIQDKGDCKKILKTKNKIFKSFITGADFKK